MMQKGLSSNELSLFSIVAYCGSIWNAPLRTSAVGADSIVKSKIVNNVCKDMVYTSKEWG
jgi:hypothetical protein